MNRRKFVAAVGALGFGWPAVARAARTGPAPNTHEDLSAAVEAATARRWNELAAIVRRLSPDSAIVLLDGVSDRMPLDDDITGLAQEPMGATIAGAFYVEWAWRYRGTGWGSSVTEEMFVPFRERLTLARESLERAIDADANDGVAYKLLFDTFRGLSERNALVSAWEAFTTTERRPIAGYSSMMNALSRRWFGSYELMEGFARRYANALEPTSQALIVGAINEMILDQFALGQAQATAFAAEPFVLGLVGVANDAFSAQPPPADRYQARYAYGHFSFYFSLLGQHELARPHLLAMENMIGPPWSVYDDPIAVIAQARALAGIGAT